jgi:2-polyprenyl-3-methyl-5-hydroxy-6-metoxy-1,4-benzoquinol methylase
MTVHDSYYSQTRPDILELVPKSTKRLMDIGCGEGRFGEAVKKLLPGCETWGVEPVPTAARVASERNDRVLACQIDEAQELPEGYFDLVTMNDVLEHLPYSEPALALVRKIIQPTGMVIISLPNVRYYLNLRDLVFRNDWEYKDFGILDRTHLRFFTQKSAARLLRNSGFDVEQIKGLNAPRLKAHYQMLFAAMPRSFNDVRFPQFAIIARPKI